MNQASRETLELFVEKTEKLKDNYRGVMGIFRNAEEEEWQFYREIDGFLLTFRIFIQQRDGIALYVPRRGIQDQPDRPKLLDLPGMSDS